MKNLPLPSEIEEIAATGNYDVLPLSTELLSDFITPIEQCEFFKIFLRIVIC